MLQSFSPLAVTLTPEIVESYFGMTDAFLGSFTLSFFLRIVIACLCGGVIGYERTRRLKEAGIRTHIIVALGAALMIIVSKYAFLDVALFNEVNVDASRVASNIITGISFLGAGVIFIRKNLSIRGLTTAAGIWATAAVGMAVGAGMYVVGIFATIVIIIVQYSLHRWCIGIERETFQLNEVTIHIECDHDGAASLRRRLEKYGMQVNSCDMSKISAGRYSLDLSIALEHKHTFDELMQIIEECDADIDEAKEIQAV